MIGQRKLQEEEEGVKKSRGDGRCKVRSEKNISFFYPFFKDQVRLSKGKIEEKIVKVYGECESAKVEER